jgi:hypothetical protein
VSAGIGREKELQLDDTLRRFEYVREQLRQGEPLDMPDVLAVLIVAADALREIEHALARVIAARVIT